MNKMKKLVAALLFATLTTPALAAVTDNQVFAYAEANYATLFSGASQSGQFQQYNYRYYPATKNYLAVDSAKVIYILGPASNGNIQPVGPVSAFEGLITAWEAKQPAASGTTGGTTGSTTTPSANPFINTTWSGTATASASSAANNCVSGSWTLTINSSGKLTGSAADNCGGSLGLLGSVDSSGMTTFGYTSSSVCTFSGQFLSTPTKSVSGTFNCAAIGISGTWAGTGSGDSTSGGSTTNSVTCNKSLYPSGVGLRDATVAEVASYAGTLKSAVLDPVTYAPTGAWSTIVVSPTGGITFKGKVEKVSSICMLTAYNQLSFYFGTGSPLPELSVSPGAKGWSFTGTPQYSF